MSRCCNSSRKHYRDIEPMNIMRAYIMMMLLISRNVMVTSSHGSIRLAFNANNRIGLCRCIASLYYSKRGPAVHRSDPYTHLDDVQDAVDSTLSYYKDQQHIPTNYNKQQNINILHTLPQNHREMISVSHHLKKRIQSLTNSNDCRRCWLQQKHCICNYCTPLSSSSIPNVKRLFLLVSTCSWIVWAHMYSYLMSNTYLYSLSFYVDWYQTHHKEICLVVDTAKLILSTFPDSTRLVVSGIGPEHQPSMAEMQDAVEAAKKKDGKCLILFPTDDSFTFEEIIETSTTDIDIDEGWDVIVIDGTWSQARKMYAKYLKEYSGGYLYRVQLSDTAVKALSDIGNSSSSNGIDSSSSGKGHQLRRHPIQWRAIATLEATRLLLDDMHTDGQFKEASKAMSHYQSIGNNAARTQLGPPRISNT